jgi:hypothetical protein
MAEFIFQVISSPLFQELSTLRSARSDVYLCIPTSPTFRSTSPGTIWAENTLGVTISRKSSRSPVVLEGLA